MGLLLSLLLLYFSGLTSTQETVAPSKEELAKAPLVTIGELISQPERYDQQLVRVNVFWTNGYHGAFACAIDSKKECIGVYLRCPETEPCEEMTKVLDRNLENKPGGEFWERSGRFALVGRFKDTKESRQNRPRLFLEVLNIEALISKPK